MTPSPRLPIQWSKPRRGDYTGEWLIMGCGGAITLFLGTDGAVYVGFVPPGYTLSDLVEGERQLREAAEKERAPATREGAESARGGTP